ncbi:hypothetical protein CNBG_3910 [Cryptococcus deuterogattii R265]|uniref:uncharacterized protein n=1 Tax=Cryptococcus deuterogattii (strain R265) TaxID=294750 RepID=UPI001934E5DB|nr:hypothetical protein CNBG_3910 [Cryptococcus deuterogattii R265]
MTVIPQQGADVVALRRGTGILQAEYSSSSSASSSSTSSAASSSGTIVGPYDTTGGGSTTVYLIALLITIIVLAGISAALVFRAYYVRRRLRRAMQESIRTGRPLPRDAAAALGIFPVNRFGGGRRRKEERQVGVMPSMWEGAMYRDIEGRWEKDEEEDSLIEKRGKDGNWSGSGWDDIDPLTVVHLIPPSPPLPPEPLIIAQSEMPSFFRSLFTTSRPRRIPQNTTYHSARSNRGRGVNGTEGDGPVGTEEIPKTEPKWTIPTGGGDDLRSYDRHAHPREGRGTLGNGRGGGRGGEGFAECRTWPD